MRKLLFLLLLLPSILFAQFNESGYYRVSNLSSGRYIWVTDYTGGISGTSADAHAIQLHSGLDKAICNPQSVIHVVYKVTENGKKYYDLQAQGTGVFQLLGQCVSITVKDAARGICMVEATKAGLQLSLGDAGVDRGFGYTELTIYGTSTNNRWVLTPVDSKTDNYFGVKPTISQNGKYYAPFYAEFAFKFASSGMKAYKISKVDNELAVAVMEEITADVIPAETPVLIECSSADVANNKLEIVDQNPAAISGNLLKGNYHCYDELSDYSKTPLSFVPFDENTMRVFSLNSEGKLALSTDKSLLYQDKFDKKTPVRYLQANSAYFASATSETPAELTLIGAAEYEQLAKQKYIIEDQKAYERLSAQLEDASKQIEQAKVKITNSYRDVAAQFNEKIENLLAQVQAIKDDLDKKHANIELTSESTIDTSSIIAAIDQILVEAQKAQEAYNQKVAANQIAYDKFSQEINNVKARLDAAHAHISAECPLVSEQYAEKLENIRTEIMALQNDLEALYKAIELTSDSDFNQKIDGITAKIASLIAEADEAQLIASGVSSIEANKANRIVYTLSGVRVDSAKLAKGIYIINGKVCMVK